MPVLSVDGEAEALGVAFLFLGEDVSLPGGKAGRGEGFEGWGCGEGVVNVGKRGGCRDGCGGWGTVSGA